MLMAQWSKICQPQMYQECRLFQTENNQGLIDSVRTFDLPPNCLKEFRQRTSSRKEAIMLNNYYILIIWTWCIDREEPSRVCLLKFPSLSTVFVWPNKHLLTNLLSFFKIFLWIAFFPPEVSSQMAYKPQLTNFVMGSHILWSPCMYVTKINFFLLICFMSV